MEAEVFPFCCGVLLKQPNFILLPSKAGQRPISRQEPVSEPGQRCEVSWSPRHQWELRESVTRSAADKPLHQPAPYTTLLWDPEETTAAPRLGVQRDLHRNPDAEPVFRAGRRDRLWKDDAGRGMGHARILKRSSHQLHALEADF